MNEDLTTEAQAQGGSAFGILISILGFGLCRAWIVFCLMLSLPGFAFTYSWVFLLSGALSALVVAVLTRRVRFSLTSTRIRLFRITASFLIVGVILIPSALYLGLWLLLIIGSILGGVGAGLLQVLWGERFASHGSRFSLVVAPAAAILTALLVALSGNIVSVIALVVVPLVSFVLLILEIDGSHFGQQLLMAKTTVSYAAAQSPETKLEPEPRELRLALWKLMFSILLFSFICRAFDALPVTEAPFFLFFGGSALFSLIVVGATMLVLSVALKGRFNVTLTYRLSLPIMMMGFAVLAFFFNTHAAISLLLINVGYEFFDILSWILFAEVARQEDEHKQDSAYRVFGLGVAFTFIGMALAHFLSEAFVGLFVNGDSSVMGIVLLSMMALVLVTFLVLPEGMVQQLMAGQRGQRGEQRAGEIALRLPVTFEERCEGVVAQYGLTLREREVLLLLARGRTLSPISRDLQIAKSTARTHIENVYIKLAVHKQQELIDLVESFEERPAAASNNLTAE